MNKIYLAIYLVLLYTMTYNPAYASRIEEEEDKKEFTVYCNDYDSDPLPCLQQHGEKATQNLLEMELKKSDALSGACMEVLEPGIGDCLRRAQELADKDLDATYARAVESIDVDDEDHTWLNQLKNAQKAWEKLRNIDCGDLIDSEWMKGTGSGAAASTCVLGHTIARTAEIKRRYEMR